MNLIPGGPGTVHLSATISDAGGERVDHCGGVIVGSHWVLTARHCVDGRVWSELRVDFGTARLGAGREGGIRRGMVAICPAATKQDSLLDDIALLRLDRDIPADLPRPTSVDTDYVLDKGFPMNASIVSFPGAVLDVGTSRLRALRMSVIGRTATTHYLAELVDPNDLPPCGGESGSPVFVPGEEGPELLAVVSAIAAPAVAKAAGVHPCSSPQTRVHLSPVAPWVDWIDATIAGCKARPENCVRP